MCRKTVLRATVVPLICASLLFSVAAVGQETEPAKPPIKRQVRGRLPAYFAAVVSQKQREEIYRIQARFQQEIDGLLEKIAGLESDRAKQVDGVLKPDQLEQVNEKRAAAAERRRSRRTSPVARESASKD